MLKCKKYNNNKKGLHCNMMNYKLHYKVQNNIVFIMMSDKMQKNNNNQ